ncbi:hypothetical protein C162_00913 [Paenibacillus sp. FSL R7-269]|nr:hypothetical protein C162_00913 [Paenibacillus sp. FSL R7-269]
MSSGFRPDWLHDKFQCMALIIQDVEQLRKTEDYILVKLDDWGGLGWDCEGKWGSRVLGMESGYQAEEGQGAGSGGS